MATGLGSQYRGPMTHYQCAKNPFEAEYPEMWEGLASTFSPCLFIARNLSSTYNLHSGRRWSVLPTDHETFEIVGTPIANLYGAHTSPRACMNTGIGASSGHFKGDNVTGNGNGPRITPLSVHSYVQMKQLSTDCIVWGTNASKPGTKKSSAADFGYKFYYSATNDQPRLEAYDGTSAGAASGRYVQGPGSLYSADDFCNCVVTTSVEPLDTTTSKMWFNGVDQTASMGEAGSGTAAFNASYDRTCYGGDGGTGASSANSLAIFHVATWRRVLADWECELLTNDPLAMYRKRPQAKSYFYPPWKIHTTDVVAGVDIVSLGGIYQTNKVVLSG